MNLLYGKLQPRPFPAPSFPSQPSLPPSFPHLESLLEIDAARECDAKDGTKQGAHQQPVHDRAREYALREWRGEGRARGKDGG